MNKTIAALAVICFVALAVRLYPSVISGLPFSVDAWPLISNTELLIKNTPLPITSLLFDGYNNFWPGSQLFGAVLAEVSALSVVDALGWGLPITAALAIPLFFLVVRKITQNTSTALVAALLLATAFPYALFTAGATKETYAAPLFMTLILLFLLKPSWKTAGLFSIASLALLLSHHLTAFLAVAVLWGLCIALVTSRKTPNQQIPPLKSSVLFAGFFFVLTMFYFGLFAYPALNVSLTISDWLSVGAYGVILVSLAVYSVYVAKGHAIKKTILMCTSGFTLLLLVLLLITNTALLPTAPTLPIHYFVYAVPFLLGVPLIIYGFNDLHQRRSSLLFPFFWIIMVAAFTCYSVFANPLGGLGLAYRSVNFVLPPFVFLVAFGLCGLVGNHRGLNRKVLGAVAVGLCLCMVSVNVYSEYAAVVLEEPYFGYFWRYEPSEYQASAWIADSGNNHTVAGDFKVQYLLDQYFAQNVSILGGLEFLESDGSPPDVVYVYGQMYRNGYVLYSGTPVALPQNWTAKLVDFNQIYSNNEVTLYANP
jgi:hypothetical protein